MKFGKIAALVLVAGCMGGVAKAQEKVQKYGVVDMQGVILAVDEGKDARATLEKEIKGKESEFSKKKGELDKMNEEWKTQAALLSEAAKAQKQQEFQEKFMGLRNAEMEFQNEIKKKEQRATQKIAMKVATLVDKMAREKKLDAVFETNSSGLLYLDNPVDLTKDVVAAYNKLPKETTEAKKDKK
jgi:outer membrane protein